MIERYCDICKRKIDKYADTSKVIYYDRAFDVDFCEDCKEKWNKFKETTRGKYNKLYEELANQEKKEVLDFLGIKEEEEKCILEKL